MKVVLEVNGQAAIDRLEALRVKVGAKTNAEVFRMALEKFDFMVDCIERDGCVEVQLPDGRRKLLEIPLPGGDLLLEEEG